ncbi:hypothetical protein BGM04_14775 [Vibrio parahaemolyticus]|nr:hypothetical protein BGM04_14775 [Vibrio parahaemolyticus]OXD91811.1 hypothetical protein CE132_16625 [Vibrio parahaemolyticus]
MRVLKIDNLSIVINHVESYDKVNNTLIVKTISGDVHSLIFDTDNEVIHVINRIDTLMTSTRDNAITRIEINEIAENQ